MLTTELRKHPGKLAIITGGNRGIGLSVVKKLLQCDITVVMGVRDPIAARKSVESFVGAAAATELQRVHYERLDIGSMKSVRQFADAVKRKFTKIDILINNAGIMAAPFALTVDNFESQLAINYLGHFLLTHLLLPELKAAGSATGAAARIVNVSSCVHKLGHIDFNDVHGM